MRTTIEIRDEHRAWLLEQAARRGEKGFSHIVAEAIERYVVAESEGREKRGLALAARGSLSADEAVALDALTRDLRASWR